MYEIIKQVIESGRYELNDMLKKIDTIWIQGNITEDQKKELVELAQNKATPENSYAPLQTQIDELYKMIKELTETVNANAKGMAAIKESVEKLGGSVSNPKPDPEPEEYPEYKQPTGAHDAYNIGDKMTFTNGKKYTCKMDGCVWGPDVYPDAWEEVLTDLL